METTTETRTLDQFIADAGIWYEWTPAATSPNADGWGSDARHFVVTLQIGVNGTDTYRRMDVPFSQGSAHVNAPTAADVLDCLANDAAGYENALDLEDWATEYGYDPDSHKAYRTYQAIQGQSALLLRFLGRELFDELLWEVERI